MKVRNTVLIAALLAVAAPAGVLSAQDSRVVAGSGQYFTNEQLDNLVAPIALYPDAILAQVLVAATFPDQVDFAARYVKANGTRGIDDQNWDVSVKAVAHYAPLLNMLADRDDWTTALGQAYASQSSEVMESVQHLREMAKAQGNLRSTDQQTVIEDNGNIEIVPAQPRVIYVPTYDPYEVYYRPVVFVGAYSGFWSFGVGFPIGAWLSYDCDWYGRRVYYDGWRGTGWRRLSYPYISINTVYVHPRYETVYINRNVGGRSVNYGNFGRYNTVHRTVAWGGDHFRSSPGPIVRRDGGYDSRRDGGIDNRRDAPARNDGRNQNDGRTQGRDNGQSRDRNGASVAPPTTRTQQADPRSAHERGVQMSRPPVAIERAAPPSVDRRSAPPTVERRSAPEVERRSAPPSVERRAAPPSVERRSAPPSVERRSAPPSVERRSAPPAVERRAAPPSVERRGPAPSSERRADPPSRSGQSRGQSDSRQSDSHSKRGGR